MEGTANLVVFKVQYCVDWPSLGGDRILVLSLTRKNKLQCLVALLNMRRTVHKATDRAPKQNLANFASDVSTTPRAHFEGFFNIIKIFQIRVCLSCFVVVLYRGVRSGCGAGPSRH